MLDEGHTLAATAAAIGSAVPSPSCRLSRRSGNPWTAAEVDAAVEAADHGGLAKGVAGDIADKLPLLGAAAGGWLHTCSSTGTARRPRRLRGRVAPRPLRCA